MLKSIHFHLNEDEEKQIAVEEESSVCIQANLQRNVSAFHRYIPSVYNKIKSITSENISIFVNQNSEINLVDYTTGRAFYGLHPEDEVLEQVKLFEHSRLVWSIQGKRAAESVSCSLNTEIEALVVFGLGLGVHLEKLLNDYEIKHIIIYEPELAYFKGSLSAINWHGILTKAQQTNTAIYLQLEKDGRDFVNDFQQLNEHFGVRQALLYKHYNHPVFDDVLHHAEHHSFDEMTSWFYRDANASPTDYVPPWTQALKPELWSHSALSQEKYVANMEAFKRFFPDVHSSFVDYEPLGWAPVGNKNGDVNLRNLKTGAYYYGERPVSECEVSLDYFCERPNKDSLVLGYSGKKLRPYLHYQLVNECEDILDSIEESHGALPTDIKSIIFFGLGVGYQLEKLINQKSVQHLFLCEPNRDFFHASLYAIDWNRILNILDHAESRLYLNVGDDGTHLMTDLLSQFHSVGPYILANSFFYQGYYNASLVNAINQIREQLRVIIAMGDYFDHSRFSISHTVWSINQKTPFLVSDAQGFLSVNNKETPVFIVGNGPSLDTLVPLIKENRDNAIVVSCGTALQTLHHHRIVPDFHAEIETNRSTFDWAARIGDLAYLKQISLISCNGIHPDTCSLYKDVYLAFKEGESATVTVTELYHDVEIPTLSYSYPTVANFVSDLFRELDFKQIYLAGIDLGFADPEYHHSKASGYYYDNGNQRYQYSEDNDVSLLVPGNFRPFVNTKYEFKVAQRVLENALSKFADVYNLNDGARISGAIPLTPDNLIVFGNDEQRQETLNAIKEKCFKPFNVDAFNKLYNFRFKQDALVEDMQMFLHIVKTTLSDRAQAQSYVDDMRAALVDSFRKQQSLLFFMLNGTLNFVNSVLTKILNIEDDQHMLNTFKLVQDKWLHKCQEIYNLLQFDKDSFDFISSFEMERRRLYMRVSLSEKETLRGAVYPDSKLNRQQLEEALGVLGLRHEIGCSSQEVDYHICVDSIPSVLSDNTVFVATSQTTISTLEQANIDKTIVYLPGDFLYDSPVCNNVIRFFISRIVVGTKWNRVLILPKLVVSSCENVEHYYKLGDYEGLFAYQCNNFVLLSRYVLGTDELLLADGTRLTFIPSKLEHTHFVSLLMTEQELEQNRLFRMKRFDSLAADNNEHLRQ